MSIPVKNNSNRFKEDNNMRCTNCNKEIHKARFCPYCGTKQEVSNDEVRSSSNSMVFALLGIAGTTAIMAVIVAFLLLGKNPVDKLKSFSESGEYTKVNDIYNEKIAGNIEYETEVYEYLSTGLNDAWNSYLSGDIDAKELDNTLDKIGKYGVDAKVTAELKAIESDYQEIKDSALAYETGRDKQSAGDYLGAITEYKKVIAEDPFNYDLAQEAIDESRELYAAGLVAEAKDSIANLQYDDAIAKLNKAKSYTENDTEIEELKVTATTLDFADNLNDYIEQDDCSGAMKCYEAAAKNSYCNISDEIEGMYVSYIEEVRKSYLTTARNTYKEKGAVAAIDVIAEGLAIFKQDEIMIKYDELLRSAIPVKLNELKEIEKKSCEYEGKSISDLRDVEYVGYYKMYSHLDSNDDKNYLTLLLSEKYTTITFKYFTESIYNNVNVQIDLDGINKVTTPYVNNMDGTNTITIDVKNADVLNIKSNCTEEYSHGFPKLIIVEGYASRELTDEDFNNIEI